MSARRPAPLARRAVSALVVSVWLFGLVGSIFHGASHEHAYCSQHKTFEEVGTGTGAASAADREDAAARSAPAATRAQHEACAFADLGVRAPLAEDFHLDVARPTPPPAPPAPSLAPAPLPIPLLALAPKASPPSPSV